MPFPINIKFYIDENILTQEQAETLSDIEIQALNTEFAREKLLNGIELKTDESDSSTMQRVSRDEAMRILLGYLGPESRNMMQFFIGIQAAIDEHILSMDQAVSMSNDKIFILANPLLRALIASGKSEFDFDAESGFLTIEQHPMTEMGELAVMFALLQELQTNIEQRACSQELTQNITFQGILAFLCYKKLFVNGILTLDELLALNMEQADSLDRLKDLVRDSFVESVRGGSGILESSVRREVSGFVDRSARAEVTSILNIEQQIPGRIHDMIKKHTISKEDILNFPDLGQLYPPFCSLIVNGKISLTEAQSFTIRQKYYLSGPNAHDLILAGIVTITQIHQLTQNQFHQLEGLNLREARVEEVCNLFGEGVIEALCGKNLDANDVDSFPEKKLKLCGFITLRPVTLKLRVIVQEEAIQYLKSFSNPQTAKGFIFLNQKFIGMERTNITEEVWNKIKEQVSKRIWDEFHSLFSSQNDPSFIELTEIGQYIKLNRSSEIQSLLENSEGYRKYCSHTLFNGRFFPYPQSVKAQNTYDEVVEEDTSHKLFYS